MDDNQTSDEYLQSAGLDAKIAGDAYVFISTECISEVAQIIEIIKTVQTMLGHVDAETMADLLVGFGTACVYRHITGSKGTEAIEKLFNAKLLKEKDEE